MIVTVADPLAEPMIHRDFPGGLEDLQEYVLEVCDGIKDHCVRDPHDPQRHALGVHLPPAAVRLRRARAGRADRPDRSTCAGSWPRPATRGVLRPSPGRPGRTAAATTRRACRACGAGSPRRRACRVLSMNVRFRSNDAYKAAFMNMFALVQLQSRIADAGRRTDRTARSGWAATATWPTATTSTAATWRSSAAVPGAVQNRTFEGRTMRYADVRDLMEEPARDPGQSPSHGPARLNLSP